MNVNFNKTYNFNILALLMFVTFYCNAQEYKTKLNYFPLQKSNVSDKDYRKAVFILEQTYDSIEKDSFYINYVNHFNIAYAYSLMLEPRTDIFSEIRLAQEKNLKSTASLFLLGVKSPEHFRLTQSEYDSLKEKFQMIHNEKSSKFNIDKYIVDENLDSKLVKLMALIDESDQRYRSVERSLGIKKELNNQDSFQLQKKLDQENLLKIDSLFKIYKKYIGRSLVGDKFKHVMWLVIQHSDLESQEKYLPIVYEAVKIEDLPIGPLKMLIDRIYSKKYDYQIFGSQMNVQLAPEEVIMNVKNEYEIE